MDPSFSILVGLTIALAVAAIVIMKSLEQTARAQFVFGQLCVMTGIYVGFAIIQFDGAAFLNKAALTPLIVEVAIALGFLIGGLGILRANQYWLLGLLLFVHGAVDLAHLMVHAPATPSWYALACIFYDAIVGISAVLLLTESERNSA